MGADERHLATRAALAGLLHDIGKLGQRAGEVSAGGRNHPAVGDKFVSQYVPPQWQPLCAPVGWHHASLSDSMTKVVALADRLSAGERERYFSKKEEEEGKVQQLLSVFPGLNSDRSSPSSPRSDLYLPLRPLELKEEALFPSLGPSKGAHEGYRSLWKGFCQDMASLQQAFQREGDLESYVLSVIYILQKYTWCVPSAFYHDRPDVSLYDHLRTTAALAACFAQQWQGREGEKEVDALLDAIRGKEPAGWPDRPEVAGMLVGDISGIQSFIYGFHHAKGAAAALRARSFYVQLLTEAAARKALRVLDLPPTNALYIGGGGFTLIVPPGARDAVEEVARSINAVLLSAHGGQLYLSLAFAPLVPRDLGIGTQSAGAESPLARRWEALQSALELRKRHRFAELSAEDLRQLFAPQGLGLGEDAVCGVCGAEDLEIERDEDGLPWCRGCRSLRELGRSLRRARYLMLAEVPEARSGKYPTWNDVMRALGFSVKVGEYEPEPPPDSARCLFLALADEVVVQAGPRTAVGYKPLVNVVPLVRGGEVIPEGSGTTPRPDEIKHFGILARQSVGAPYLGVLRMDMDNLGKLFSRGLGGRDTLSRRATLSFHLTLFFEGWVGEAARLVGAGGPERLYAVYSGGDDLFFVGSWDEVAALARVIRADFARFTGRTELGISGGIVLVHEKYPLYLAAEKAQGVVDAAKDVRREKDALAFLGQAVPWERFGYRDGQENTVVEWAAKLQRLMSEQGAPRAIVRRIQDFYLMYRGERDERGAWGPWVWRAAYTLAQAAERAPGNLKQEIHRLAELLAGECFGQNIEWLALAARWAELATREGGYHDLPNESGPAG